jgi:hypothetical protein
MTRFTLIHQRKIVNCFQLNGTYSSCLWHLWIEFCRWCFCVPILIFPGVFLTNLLWIYQYKHLEHHTWLGLIVHPALINLLLSVQFVIFLQHFSSLVICNLEKYFQVMILTHPFYMFPSFMTFNILSWNLSICFCSNFNFIIMVEVWNLTIYSSVTSD